MFLAPTCVSAIESGLIDENGDEQEQPLVPEVLTQADINARLAKCNQRACCGCFRVCSCFVVVCWFS